MWTDICVLVVFMAFCAVTFGEVEVEEHIGPKKFTIEGKVSNSYTSDSDWISNTRILIDGGQYLGFLRNDGSFIVSNVPSGSYVVEVINPTFVFEPARIDINSKGKFRARKVDNLQSSKTNMNYPLKFKVRGMANYFQRREEWRITDFIFSPMVLMMVGPFLLLMVLPKLVNTQDPETQKELQQSMNFMNPKQSMPEMSEMLTNFGSLFGGSSPPAKKTAKAKASKKRQ